MKLDRFNGQYSMTKPHDVAIIFGSRGDLKNVGQPLMRHDQRMISGSGKRVGLPLKASGLIMANHAHLAMHEVLRLLDLPPKRQADGLMPQAHSKDGKFTAILTDQVNIAGIGRMARSGSKNDIIRRELVNIQIALDSVIPDDTGINPNFHEILKNDVNEAIVSIH